ncbi:GNAT family N-acetyltransferase [Chitinimonas naiadis]
MQIELKPYDPSQDEALGALRRRQAGYEWEVGDPLSLADAARGHGRQACSAWLGETALGYAAWVLLGVEQDGCAYGSPLLATDIRAASLLIATVRQAARDAGASRLRISARLPEQAKRQALEAAGFTSLFDFVHLQIALPLAGQSGLPAGLHSVPVDQIDWSRMQACYAETFAHVPNAPVPDVATMQAEWLEADWQSSCVLADPVGEYQAFLLITEGEVDAVGVCEAWRGHDLAAILYRRAGPSLLAQGHAVLRAMVASTNRASMRLHEKLGFSERMPSWTVYERHL